MMSVSRKISAAVLAASVLTGATFALPQPAEALSLGTIGSIVGTAISGAAVYKQVDKQIDYYDKTDEGANEIYQKLQESQGVTYDEARTAQLDSIMARLSDGIAASDPSIKKKPFRYFLNPQKTFNAACSMGHVMTVNIGLFDYLSNDDEVAVVLGHEMAHGMKNHVASSTRKKINTEIAASMVASTISGGALNNLLLNIVVNNIEQVHIGKKDEWQADNLGYDYIYAAGYNPGAAAATWARVIKLMGDNSQNFVGEMFSPSDHPSNEERMQNYEKKLVKLSGDKVKIKDGKTIQINGKDFLTPVEANGMFANERMYFIMGNLAAAYNHGHGGKAARASGSTVMLGPQPILKVAPGEPSAPQLAELLNKIK